MTLLEIVDFTIHRKTEGKDIPASAADRAEERMQYIGRKAETDSAAERPPANDYSQRGKIMIP